MNEGDPKAENLLLKFWYGKSSSHCDGSMKGYSILNYIYNKQPKKSMGNEISYYKIVTCDFMPNFDVDYSFQYKYRVKSIAYFFRKEFFSAICLLVFF
jgi:hypothetical protein